MNLKEKVYQHYLSIVNDKIIALQNILQELADSAKNETKSTAGDKHETALAMLQIEQKNTQIKLQDAIAQKNQLLTINRKLITAKITIGTLIKTNNGFFYLSVALGKSIIDDIAIIAISPQSPLGAKLIGLEKYDTAEINGTKYIVEAIF